MKMKLIATLFATAFALPVLAGAIIHDKNARDPKGYVVELQIQDGKVTDRNGKAAADGVYRLADGHSIDVRKGVVVDGSEKGVIIPNYKDASEGAATKSGAVGPGYKTGK